MIKLKDLLNETAQIYKNVNDPDSFLKKKGIKWTSKHQPDPYTIVYKDGKKKIAYYEPNSRNRTLQIQVPDIKSKGRVVTALDEKIHNILSGWVISSLSNFSKREGLAKKLLSLNIPKEYKRVPRLNLYRVISVEEKPDKRETINLSKKGVVRSWAYHPFGVEKMADWYDKIKEKGGYKVIIKKPVKNVIICIPTFYNLFPQLSTGSKFDALWASEYEVICKNKNPLITAKPNEWTIMK